MWQGTGMGVIMVEEKRVGMNEMGSVGIVGFGWRNDWQMQGKRGFMEWMWLLWFRNGFVY